MVTRTETTREDQPRPRLLPPPEDRPPVDLLPAENAVKRSGLKRRQLAEAIRRHELAAIVYKRGKDGRITLFAIDPRDLDAWIAAHRQEAEK